MVGLSAYYHTNEDDTDTHWAPSTTFTANGPLDDGNNADHFTIGNNSTGATQGYSLELFSASEDGDFTYDGSNHPTGGTIGFLQVSDAATNSYFTICFPADVGNGDTDLGDFWNTLVGSGAKAALDQLIGDDLTVYGSSETDFAETYGTDGTYYLNEGNDTLYVSYAVTTAYGGTGSDTFVITKGGLAGLSLHGGDQPTALVNTPDIDSVNFAARGTLSFDEIDGIDRFNFRAPTGGQFIYLTTDQIPGGSIASFHVAGSASGATNEIVIERAGSDPLNLNFSHVTVSNFGRLNQAFVFDFTGDAFRDVIVGVQNARNDFELGARSDRAYGGALGDIFNGGGGNDFFSGRGGVDIAVFDGTRAQFRVTEVNAHQYLVQDLRAHSPDGADTLINVEYLSFTNKYVFIGELHA